MPTNAVFSVTRALRRMLAAALALLGAAPPAAGAESRSDRSGVFTAFIEALDTVNYDLHRFLQRRVEAVDTALLAADAERQPTPPARFRLGPLVTWRDLEGGNAAFKAELAIEAELPNLKRWLAVFVESGRTDSLPGLGAAEAERSSLLGLRRFWEGRGFSADLGVQLRAPPVLFARVEWRDAWSLRKVLFLPRQRLFRDTRNGWGSLTSLTVHHWFGAAQEAFVQAVSAARYTTRTTDGFELEQSLIVGRVLEPLEPGWNWRKVPGTGDIARGHTLRHSVFAHAGSSECVVDRHLIAYTYRQPLYKRWVYLEVTPGLEWARADGWRTRPRLDLGLDLLLWGTRER